MYVHKAEQVTRRELRTGHRDPHKFQGIHAHSQVEVVDTAAYSTQQREMADPRGSTLGMRVRTSEAACHMNVDNLHPVRVQQKSPDS